MTHEELLEKLSNHYHKHSFYRIKDWREDDFDEDGCHMEVFELLDSKKPLSSDFLEIPYTVNGDYVGDVCSKSNCRSIKRDFTDDVILTWGSYDSEMLLVRLEDLAENEDLLKVIEDLTDYPSYDESDESELLIELESEAWDNWLEYDFKRELQKLLNDEDIDENTHDLQTIFWKFQELTGECFEPEGTSVIFHIDHMLKRMTEDFPEKFKQILEENKKDEI